MARTVARRGMRFGRGVCAALLVMAVAGCRNWDSEKWFLSRKPDHAVDSVAGDRPATPDTDHWTRRLSQVEDRGAPRWRHAELEALLAAPPERRPDFATSLTSEKEAEAVNAAIVLARLGDDQGARVLSRGIDNAKLRVQMRAAALEALGGLPTTKVEALTELVERYQDFEGGDIYLPELHAEILMALARRPSPSLAPAFQRGLQSPSVETRLASIGAWKDKRLGPLPQEIVTLRGDADPRVRAATILVSAARGEAEAIEAIQRGLADYHIEVRVAAVRAIGEWKGPNAADLAKRAMADPSEAIRAEAVSTLCALGERSEVQNAANDASWRVRQAVARSLASAPPEEWRAVAVALLDDPSVEVQQTAVAAIDQWPAMDCEPLLLKAMEQTALATRRLATARLAKRWKEAGEFVADAASAERNEVLSRLRHQWEALHPDQQLVDAAVKLVSHQYPEIPAAIDEIQRVRELLDKLDAAQSQPDTRRQILALLRAEGERLPVILEFLVRTEGRRLADDVYLDALAQIDDAFRAVEDLKSEDVETRRRAAARLGEIAATVAVRHLIAGRVSALCMGETDTLVWRALIDSLGNEVAPELIQLFSAAMGHPSAEVRRMACEHFQRHGCAEGTPLLLKALEDPNPAVVLAAVQALARAPGALDAAPLERLLAVDDKRLRLEVAATLVSRGHRAGIDALERLAHDEDPKIRLGAAQRMAESLAPEFSRTLVELLDDSLGVRQAALAGLRRLHREDGPISEAADDIHAQAAAWKAWWKNRPLGGSELR